jgi:hypothetical protein
MAENIQSTRGLPPQYRLDRGGVPAIPGPFIGVVKNNVDYARSGRLRVFIRAFDTSSDPNDENQWRTVRYLSPFYGKTPHAGTSQGTGTYLGNPQSYGMWFTAPDIGTEVLCMFVDGDPSEGYYLGCVIDPGVNHMLPAVGASRRFRPDNAAQEGYFAGVSQLPVTEINTLNLAAVDSPRYFDLPRPVHSVVAAAMFQQGTLTDVNRGPITSNGQRETPSAVFGVSTPGRPVYQGGLQDADIDLRLQTARLQDLKIIGRRGGHTLVMDDGDINGNDNLVRIRTAKGHQITMSDNGDFFYIIHANGQTWIELGSEGTVDVYAANSVNIRTKGQLNLHADQDININAGGNLRVKAENITMESRRDCSIMSENAMSIYGKLSIGIRSDGTLALKNATAGSWGCGGSLNIKASAINLNGPAAANVDRPKPLTDLKLPDTVFNDRSGWQVAPGALTTIVTRAPTHEPYPYHNRGADVEVS